LLCQYFPHHSDPLCMRPTAYFAKWIPLFEPESTDKSYQRPPNNKHQHIRLSWNQLCCLFVLVLLTSTTFWTTRYEIITMPTSGLSYHHRDNLSCDVTLLYQNILPEPRKQVAIKLIKKESIESPNRRSKLMREISILQVKYGSLPVSLSTL
jgi:hypothetical protein